VKALAAIGVVLAACAQPGTDLAPDAGGAQPDAYPPVNPGFEWTVFVSVLDGPATVRIDGVDGDNGHWEWYETEEEVQNTVLLVESVIDGTVMDRVWSPADCDHVCGEEPWVRHKEHLFVYRSGEIRIADRECVTPERPCELSWAEPRCVRDQCPVGRCGIDRVDADPSHGWLDCVPTGVRAAGESCAIDAAGIDDCAANLHCVEAVCRRACELELDFGEWVDVGHCGGVGSCEQLAGMSPEVGVCSE
jgi:hypothetical protein